MLSASKITYNGSENDSNSDSVFCDHVSDKGIFVVVDDRRERGQTLQDSTYICDNIETWWKTIISNPYGKTLTSVANSCVGLIRQINDKLATEHEALEINAGSSLSLLLIWDNEYSVINVGNSRIYRKIRRSLVPLTRDDGEDAEGQVNRLLGRRAGIDIRSDSGRVGRKDMFLLCSEVVHKALSQKEIDGIFSGLASFVLTDDYLLSLIAKTIEGKAGVKDAYSAILCSVGR